MEKVNVEAQKMHVVHGFKFDWVAEKVVVDEGLDGWMGEEVFVVYDEAVVNIAVVGKAEARVVEEVVVKLVPGVFDEGDGYVAKGWRQLGSNPSASDLLVSRC